MGTKKYRIQSHEEEILCGHLADGRQVLIFGGGPTSDVFLFDRDGLKVSDEVVPLPGEMAGATLGAGFEAGTIHVQNFEYAERGLAIRDLPQGFEEFLKDPTKYEPDPVWREKTQKNVLEWQRAGNYVLTFGKEYWMCGDGSVHST